MKTQTRRIIILGVVSTLLCATPINVHANGCLAQVTNTADIGPGSLREALATASDGDTITFCPDVSGTILLTSGALNVDKSVTITGPGQDQLTVDGHQLSQVFIVGQDKTVTISGLTIANGWTYGTGGGVYNDGTLTVRDCTIRGNYARDGGGGVITSGSLVITRCTLSGNSAGVSEDYYGGGAVACVAPSGWPDVMLTIESSLLISNAAPYGGGILIFANGEADYPAHASVVVTNSTLSGNSTDASFSPRGGGIAVMVDGDAPENCSATVTVANSTLSGNFTSSVGGAIDIETYGGGAMVILKNSTLNGNWADNLGGAIVNESYFGGVATVTLKDSTLNGNEADFAGGAIANFGDDSSTGSALMTMENCTLSGNSVVGSDAYGGAAVLNVAGTVTLTNCTLTGNSSPYIGGAIFNIGTLALVDSALSSNSAVNGGGAICNGFPDSTSADAMLTLTRCTLTDNSVTAMNLATGFQGGGAIWNTGFSSTAALTIEDSTLSGNSAQLGGAILNTSDEEDEFEDPNAGPGIATVTIVRSTLNGNSATGPDYAFGGAIASLIASEGGIVVKNSTLANNSVGFISGGTPVGAVAGAIAAQGGTLTVDNSTLSGNVDAGGPGYDRASGILAYCATTIKNTILANDPSGPNLAVIDPDVGTITSAGYNLSSDDGGGFLTAAGDKINTNPQLGPLANNGGPTWTCALLAGSPAIDAGSSTDSAGNTVATDQRGVARPLGAGYDIGAFELQPSSTVYVALIQQPINADGSSTFKAKKGVVPVKFTLTVDGTPTCELPAATIAVSRVGGTTAGPIDEATYSMAADNGSNFRINDCQYVYNLSAKSLSAGTYRVQILIAGKVVGSATFELK